MSYVRTSSQNRRGGQNQGSFYWTTLKKRHLTHVMMSYGITFMALLGMVFINAVIILWSLTPWTVVDSYTCSYTSWPDNSMILSSLIFHDTSLHNCYPGDVTVMEGKYENMKIWHLWSSWAFSSWLFPSLPIVYRMMVFTFVTVIVIVI